MNHMNTSESNTDLDETFLFIDTEYINSNYNFNNEDSVLLNSNCDNSICSSLTSVRTFSMSNASLPTPKTFIEINNNNQHFFPENVNTNLTHSFASTLNLDEDDIAASNESTKIFGTSCNENSHENLISPRLKIRRNAITSISSSVQSMLFNLI